MTDLHNLPRTPGSQHNLFCTVKGHLVQAGVLGALQVPTLDEATALERGDTLTLLYTYGTTIPIWGLRFSNPEFGAPIAVPSPSLPPAYHALPHGWWNFYDEDDVLGYPIKKLNDQYDQVVVEDRKVGVGAWFSGWTPLSHTEYDTDKDVLDPIADALAATWKALNVD